VSAKRWDRARFKALSVHVDGGYQRSWQICCAKCSATELMADNTQKGFPPEIVGKKFSSRGWMVGASKDWCPDCVAASQRKVVSMKAEEPRTPTREDRRRIIDALEEHYDTKHERYTANWSDKSLAAKLTIPVAWVAEERDRAYGPDINEAFSKRTQAVTDLEKRFSDLEDATLKALDDVRVEISRLKVDASYKVA